MHFFEGKEISGYLVVRTIGAGGMSTVYEAFDQNLKRKVALKILHAHLLTDKVAQERFRREALAAAKIEHPNIVRIYDYLTQPDFNAIVMEYIPGKDVEALVMEKGPFSFQDALFVMNKVAFALKSAHEHDIIHRDVKPSNILIHEEGRVILTDFGLAHHFADSRLTMGDGIAGTPQFMSPEQISSRNLTTSTDIYSWAITFYYLLTGRFPYVSNEFITLIKEIESGKITFDPKVQKIVAPKYCEILERCLVLNPEERIPNGDTLLTWIRKAGDASMDTDFRLHLADGKHESRPKDRPEKKTRVLRAKRFALKKKIFAALLLVLACTFFFLGITGKYYSSRSVEPASQPAADGRQQIPVPALVNGKEIFAAVPPPQQAAIKGPSKKTRSPGVLPLQKASMDSGKLFVFSDPWANILIDGRLFGKTPLGADEVLGLNAGRHVLELRNDYYLPLRDTLVIRKGMLTRKRYHLERLPEEP